MKHFILVLTLLPFFTFCKQTEEEKKAEMEVEINNENTVGNVPNNTTATYYLIRHAEKVLTDPNNEDPSLDIKGMMRAKGWATYFTPIKIHEIYITKYIRTKQTASLIAQQKSVIPKSYDPQTIYSQEFLTKTNGKTVLIVGHSNTIPKLVNQLIGEEKFQDMDDSDNATLFKVTLDGNDKKVETITVE